MPAAPPDPESLTTPAPESFTAPDRESWCATEPGISLHVEDWGAGPPIVLLHGWAMSSRALAGLAAILRGSHRVVAPDLRGHGRSRAPACADYSLAAHARDLAALLDGLDLSGAVLLGWSLGAQIALEALPAIAQRLGGLVLLAATPRFLAGDGWPHGLAPSRLEALAARVRRDGDRAGSQAIDRFFAGMFAKGELAPAAEARLRRAVLGAAPAASREAALGGLEALRTADQRPALAAVDLPTLFIHGACDPICLPGASAFAATRVAGARRLELPGAGHAPQLSRPAAVAGAVAAFAAGVRGEARGGAAA